MNRFGVVAVEIALIGVAVVGLCVHGGGGDGAVPESQHVPYFMHCGVHKVCLDCSGRAGSEVKIERIKLDICVEELSAKCVVGVGGEGDDDTPLPGMWPVSVAKHQEVLVVVGVKKIVTDDGVAG